MYFSDRVSLGHRVSDSLSHLCDQGVIVVCLKDSSLLMCTALASRLHGWVYPLSFESIYSPDDESTVIGAIHGEGEFCLDLKFTETDYDDLQNEYASVLSEKKRQALSRLNSINTPFSAVTDKHIMNGRYVIVAGDVLLSSIELAVVTALLKPLAPQEIHGVIGNTTPDVSDLLHLHTTQLTILDILPGIVFDDDHYFQRLDPYSVEQKREIAMNIQAFWE